MTRGTDTQRLRRKAPTPDVRGAGRGALRNLAPWMLGLAALGALVGAILHLGEVSRFVELIRQAQPAWLLVALALQVATYQCVAAAWGELLRRGGAPIPISALFPLAVAKLFADQAMPSGGISGTTFLVSALVRRGVALPNVLAALLVMVVTFYGAYLTLALVTLGVLVVEHAATTWVVALTAGFALFATLVPAGVVLVGRSSSHGRLRRWLESTPARGLLRSIEQAPAHLLRRPAAVMVALVCQGAVFLLDAATLWVVLRALGEPTGALVVLPAFVVASMVATLSPIPLGLGTFETSCVGMLHLLGVPIETALAATLLLRGFTIWLPMLPGLWLARRALRPPRGGAER